MLEVERKFCPLAAALIVRNAGFPPFRRFLPQPQKVFRDTYYDHGEVLRKAGIWVRKREEQWEAKVKVGGDYINSQFQEVRGPKAVDAAISSCLQGYRRSPVKRPLHLPSAFDASNIGPVAEFVTTRDSWTVDDEYTIVIDSTDFGHIVGEVELEYDHPDHLLEDAKNVFLKQANEKIASFMRHYAWAFPPGECKGKLTAYFEWTSRGMRAEKLE